VSALRFQALNATLCSLGLAITACASAPTTCFYPSNNFKDQYLVHFPRHIVVQPGDPGNVAERHKVYAERLNSYFRRLPGAESCRTVDFGYYEGGGISARAECPVGPPLTRKPGGFKQDGSPSYWACYSDNEGK
jgi:hypothetical protein